MTVEQLKHKMAIAERICEDAIHQLQDNDIEVLDVRVDKIETTTKDTNGRTFIFDVKIDTKIIT
jgi:hypothetical protein